MSRRHAHRSPSSPIEKAERVVQYLRWAESDQDGLTLESQAARLAANPWKLPTPTKAYEDLVSSTSRWVERPRLGDLLRDARDGLFDLVQVAQLDRLSGSQLDQFEIISHLE